MAEDGGRRERSLESLKSFLGRGGPGEGTQSFLSEPGQRGCQLGVSLNKSVVKVGKTEEALDILQGSGLGPRQKGVNFCRVHLDALR